MDKNDNNEHNMNELVRKGSEQKKSHLYQWLKSLNFLVIDLWKF